MATQTRKTSRKPRNARTSRAVARRRALRGVKRFTPTANAALDVIAKEIADVLERRELTQSEAARIMRDAPSQISLLVTGKYRGFSIERALSMLARLGYKIEIIAHELRDETAKGTIDAYVQRV